ncbi:MAG: copper chaperone PCu(A)C [Thermodesulfovibrionales bacterium]|nr:copper chaperone PCu(A)C [Thermodesulfovibrionales bacterium]
MIRKSAIVVMVILIVAMSAGIAMGMGASTKLPDIRIEDAKAYLSPMMSNTTSVFMKITNTGKGSDNLVGASVDMPSAVVELHDVKDGKMAAIDKISIPPDEVVELKPKSLHIMIFKMPKGTKAGHEFTLRLKFERSGEKTLMIKLTEPMSDMPMHKH